MSAIHPITRRTPNPTMFRLAIPALLILARVASAQGPGIRVSPQFVQYALAQPIDVTVIQMAVPVFAVVPIGSKLTLDVGSAFAHTRVNTSGSGPATESEISGPTDTQVRMTLNLGTDRLVLTGGVNVPTGSSTADPRQQSAAGLIGNDFLVFPISSMGSGLGGTGGLALAQGFGEWNVGLGLSFRHSMPFDPYEDAAGAKLRYTPGDEMRARVGLDHPFGTGRVAVGVTYSKFKDDMLGSASATPSIYNTGDRIMTQGYVANSMAGGDYVLSAWNLFRASGRTTDGTTTGTESISDVSASYGMSLGGFRIEPGVNGRMWMQEDAPMSVQGTGSIRLERAFGRLVIAPGASVTFGSIASSTTDSATMSGFRAQLTMRLQ